MKERGILFSAEMVRAILDGRKTQTRRGLNPQPFPAISGKYPPSDPFLCDDGIWRFMCGQVSYDHNDIRCPFGLVGDRLYVRETHAILDCRPDVVLYDEHYRPTTEWPASVYYSASDRENPTEPVELQYVVPPDQWRPIYDADHQIIRPSIHMPRWASRITLGITGIRVEQLRNLSEADAVAEGYSAGAVVDDDSVAPTARSAFAHGHFIADWEANPWVWVIEFKRIEQQQVAA